MDTTGHSIAVYGWEDPFTVSTTTTTTIPRVVVVLLFVIFVLDGGRCGNDIEAQNHHRDHACQFGRGEEAAWAECLAAAPGAVGAGVLFGGVVVGGFRDGRR